MRIRTENFVIQHAYTIKAPVIQPPTSPIMMNCDMESQSPYVHETYGRTPQYGRVRIERQPRRTPKCNAEIDSDISSAGAIAMSIFVCLLFLAIIGIAAQYSSRGYYQGLMLSPDHYTDDKWWCYHCTGSACTSKCWQ